MVKIPSSVVEDNQEATASQKRNKDGEIDSEGRYENIERNFIDLGLDASRLWNVGSPLSTSIPYVTSYKNSRVLLFDVWARSHISSSVKELCLLLSILIVGRPLTIFLLLISMQENSLLSSFCKEIYFDKKSDFCGFRTSS